MAALEVCDNDVLGQPHDHGGWILSIFGTLIILALIVGAIVWMFSKLGNRSGSRAALAVSTGEILDRRLANGEITPEQYDQAARKAGH
jgi:uncharacterized membrane protein